MRTFFFFTILFLIIWLLVKTFPIYRELSKNRWDEDLAKGQKKIEKDRLLTSVFKLIIPWFIFLFVYTIAMGYLINYLEGHSFFRN